MTRSVPRPVPRLAPRSAMPSGPGLVPPDAARELLTAAGVAVIETVLCSNAGLAVSAAARLGYPVVAKVAHPALTHKSDVGGVRLGLLTAEAVRSAAADLFALADGAAVTPDHEHDEFAWWPREIDQWPAEAGEALPRMARWLSE